ncbi:MAG TPA: DUF1805 domain-containing protein [Bacillota bacterium]|nr:DUF1805 domain-containing protein [Bacillota bacterium]
MITINPVDLDGIIFTAIRVELPKTNLLIVSNEIGYIMCAALDVAIFDEKLSEREVIAGRAMGVRSIDQLLDAPLESVTAASTNQFGWYAGMTGKDALLRIA